MKTLLCPALVIVAMLSGSNVIAQEKVNLVLHVLDAETGEPVAGYHALAFDSPAIIFGVPSGEPNAEWIGDALGVATIEFKPSAGTNYQHRLQVFQPNYVSFEKWWSKPSPKSETFPTEYTVRLERGVAIGGVVKDHDAKPMSGVRVYPLRRAFGAGTPAESWPALQSTYTLDASNSVHATSDTSGRWKLDHFPASVGDVDFAFVRPDESFVTVYTASDRFAPPSGPVIPLPEFLAGNAEVLLPRGETITGIVTAADGAPLAGVSLGETHGRAPGIVARTVTGGDGRFVLPNRPAKEIVLVARLPGRALHATNILVEPGLPEIHLVLRPQQGITGRVVDGDNKPIVAARVALDQHQRFGPMEWEGTKTDAEGRFRWDAGPFEPTELYILPSNGPVRKVTLRAGEPEKLIILRSEQAQSIRLTGTVLDAATGDPVKKFTVVRSGFDYYPFNFKEEGHDGILDMKLPLKAWRENFRPVGELQVMADGFASQPIGQIDFHEGDREFRIKLKPGVSKIAGVVLDPEGKPAEGAKIELARANSFTFLNRPGEFQRAGPDSQRVTTAADGKYSFDVDQRNKSVVVVHESGFAASWASNLVGAASIQLQPWAQINGVAKESGKPLPNQGVTLLTPRQEVSLRTSSGPRIDPFGISYRTGTDSEGRFSFTKVPPGRFALSRQFPPPASRDNSGPIEFTHGQGIMVRAGESKEVIYGGKGRTVLGIAQGDPPGFAVNWQWDINFLTPVDRGDQPSPPNFNDYASQETFMAARLRFQNDPKGDSAERERRYQLVFESDGRFQITDVPPGKYELVINLTEAQPGRQSMMYGSGKSIGASRQTIVIPEGPLDQPVDLGNILVKLTGNLPQARSLPPFEALAFDGKPLHASDWRGKHVVLVFWAGWCRASAEAIPDLERIYSDFQKNPRFTMVGVSLDESASVARANADKLGLKWATGWLDEPGRLRLIETYGVRGTPTIFLLDPAGNIAARDLKPATLRAALDKALGSPTK